MQVFVKFSVGLDAIELLKQMDELGESRVTKLLFTCHVRNVKSLVPYKIFFSFSSVFGFYLVILRKVKSWIYLSIFFRVSFFCFVFFNFIYLFLAVLGLRFCARAFTSCVEWGPLFIAVRGPLTIAASLVAEHRLQTRRLSSCGSRA